MADTIEITDGTGLYKVPKTGGAAGATIPVRVLKARRSGAVRVDLLVTPIGGSGSFWVRQSSLEVREEEEEEHA